MIKHHHVGPQHRLLANRELSTSALMSLGSMVSVNAGESVSTPHCVLSAVLEIAFRSIYERDISADPSAEDIEALRAAAISLAEVALITVTDRVFGSNFPRSKNEPPCNAVWLCEFGRREIKRAGRNEYEMDRDARLERNTK